MRLLPQLGIASLCFLTGIAVHSQLTAGNAQSLRVPQFENDTVKVWKSVVLPKQPLSLHRHDHPRVIVALTAGTLDLVDQSGTIDRHVWEAGKAYWLSAMPTGALHSDVNPGDKPMEVMVVELEKEK
jgi:redox-sensitive bicupin YhaK (pirin superfamily)